MEKFILPNVTILAHYSPKKHLAEVFFAVFLLIFQTKSLFIWYDFFMRSWNLWVLMVEVREPGKLRKSSDISDEFPAPQKKNSNCTFDQPLQHEKRRNRNELVARIFMCFCDFLWAFLCWAYYFALVVAARIFWIICKFIWFLIKIIALFYLDINQSIGHKTLHRTGCHFQPFFAF